jgi:GNAT superfamily N-acetyltransferase
MDGVSKTLKDLLYFNREIILVEKDLVAWEPKDFDQSFEYIIVDRDNSRMIEKRFNLPLFYHYTQNNCNSVIAVKDNKCLGFIRWTEDKNFQDLQKFGIKLEPDQAYMFDFFIFPEYRGSSAGKDISHYAILNLKNKGISKYFGYFFSDNFPALWWHRTVCKTTEYKKIKVHKLIAVEFLDGKMYS